MEPIEWRTIEGFADYEVSNTGEVRRKDAWKQYPAGHILRQKSNVNGYPVLTLYRDRQGKSVRVSRLVALAFLGDPPTLRHVAAHNDGNKLINTPDNLHWATAAENNAETFALGVDNHTFGEIHHAAVLTDSAVAEMRQAKRSGESYKSISARTGYRFITVYDAVSGKTWKHVTEKPTGKTNARSIAHPRPTQDRILAHRKADPVRKERS